jgi:hypothetical protein
LSVEPDNLEPADWCGENEKPADRGLIHSKLQI